MLCRIGIASIYIVDPELKKNGKNLKLIFVLLHYFECVGTQRIISIIRTDPLTQLDEVCDSFIHELKLPSFVQIMSNGCRTNASLKCIIQCRFFLSFQLTEPFRFYDFLYIYLTGFMKTWLQ